MKDWLGTDIEVGSVITTGHGGRQLQGVVLEVRGRDPRGVATCVVALTAASNGDVAGARMVIRSDKLTVLRTVADLDADVERVKEAARAERD